MDSIQAELEKQMKSLKSVLNNVFIKDLSFILALSFLVLLSYWKVISKDVVLNYDDQVLLLSLRNIQNLSHYFSSIFNGQILDIQPIRDLSFYFDFKIMSILPSYSFHFTNTIIWLLICTNVRQIFLTQSPKNYYVIGLIVLLYALSPISANSVAWISARKHLLSTLFITYATLVTLKNRNSLSTNNILVILLFYFMSCFSQPINTLWILWLFYVLSPLKQEKPKSLLMLVISFICLISIGLNFYYYKFIYSANVTSMSKFLNYSSLQFGESLLALGRYFYQCLNPFSALPTSHYEGSWENLAGLALLTVFLVYCYKEAKSKRPGLNAPLIYFFFPLILVTLNMTNIFCSDTYLLNSSIGLYWVFLVLTERFESNKTFIFLLSLYVSTVALYNFNYIKIFNNEDHLWLYAYNKEATPQTSIVASSIYIKEKRFQESYEIIKEIQNRWPGQPFLPKLIAENIFYNPNITNDIKIKLLNDIQPKMPSTFLYLSVLYGYEKNIEALKTSLYLIFLNPSEFNLEFRGNETRIASIFKYTCMFYKLSSCDLTLEEFKRNNLSNNWDDKEIENLMEKLNKSETYKINL